MTAVAIILTGGFLVSPFVSMPQLLRLIVFWLALLAGCFYVLAGGLHYWWDKSMRPDQATPLFLVCGLLILASQVAYFLRALADE